MQTTPTPQFDIRDLSGPNAIRPSTKKLGRPRRAIWRALVFVAFMAGGSLASWAVDDYPGDIKGKIGWNNPPLSTVGVFLNDPATPHGFGSWSAGANNQDPSYLFLSASSSG